MHVDVFQVAKKYLTEEHGFNVICGLISPSHDEYVSRKLPESYIPAIDRIKMCELAIQSDPEFSWLAVDEWESTQQYFKSLYSVSHHLDKAIREEFPNQSADKLGVMFLCGADLILRCGMMTSLGSIPIVAVGRPGYSQIVRGHLASSGKEKDIYFVPQDTEDVSSTKIRQRIANGESVHDLTYSSVRLEYFILCVSLSNISGNQG